MPRSTSRSPEVATALRSVLLVEDNPDDEALVRRVLRKNAFPVDVVCARDGAEALELIHGWFTGGQEPTRGMPLVLLDLKMPRLGGLEVLRALRSDPRTRLLNVVVFTSSSEDSDILESYRLGACSYVRKPIDYEAFSRAVIQLLEYWLGLNAAIPRVPRREPWRFSY